LQIGHRKEYKVVLLGEKVVHLLPASALHHATPATKFSSYPHTELKAFAQTCVRILRQWSRPSITHGLMRVDIMQTKRGNLVLNEFESFEANYYSSIHSEEFHVMQFLTEFWTQEMHRMFSRLYTCNEIS